MKRLTMAALAILTLMAFVGCDATGSSGSKKSSSSKTWKIKGTHTNPTWDISESLIADSSTGILSIELDGLFALDYEFVILNPAGNEFKYSTADNVDIGSPFTLAKSGETGGEENINFAATKTSYVLDLDITDVNAPVATLTAGATTAGDPTNADLADHLWLKGNQFSEVDGDEVDGWNTSSQGTYDAGTGSVSWNVLLDNKNGEFGFSSLDGFLAHTTIDTDGLSEGDETDQVELTVSGSGNVQLLNPGKSGSIYTLTIYLDAENVVDDGRYYATATLTTESDTDWAFEPWATVFLNGQGLGTTVSEWGSTSSLTITSGAAHFDFVANLTGVNFKPSVLTGWGGANPGLSGITQGDGSLTLSDSGGNIHFDTTAGNTYRIQVAFTGTYLTDGKPVITVTDITP